MTKSTLEILSKYKTHRLCTNPNVYTKYICLYVSVIFLKAFKIAIFNGQLQASSRTYPTIKTTITKHIY